MLMTLDDALARVQALEREVTRLREESGIASWARALVARWRVEQATYPNTSEGRHVAAAVRICARELEEAAEVARLKGSRYRDGFHVSTTQGYGHQRCERCGLEWDFNPPKPKDA